MTPTINSYFSGGGLMDIGLLQAGLRIGKSYEIDATCCSVQAANLGDHVYQADISEKLADIIEHDPRITMPKAVARRMAGEYRDLQIISDPERGDIAPTCVAHYAKDKSTRLVADKRYPLGVRPYSVREYARLQGVPDWYQFTCSDTDAYRMIGNGVSVPVGEWLGREFQRYFGFEEAA
jgi:site-specific DNA-cytosine methylase